MRNECPNSPLPLDSYLSYIWDWDDASWGNSPDQK